MEQNEQTGIVKQLTDNLRKIASLPKSQWPEPRFAQLAPMPDEKAAAYRVRALEVIGGWWGYAGHSVRSFEGVERREPIADPPSNERWPKQPQFYDDLRKYGNVRFTGSNGDARLVKASLNTGMELTEYMRLIRPTGGGTMRRKAKPTRRARA